MSARCFWDPGANSGPGIRKVHEKLNFLMERIPEHLFKNAPKRPRQIYDFVINLAGQFWVTSTKISLSRCLAVNLGGPGLVSLFEMTPGEAGSGKAGPRRAKLRSSKTLANQVFHISQWRHVTLV